MNTHNNLASKALAVLVRKASVVNNENGMSTIEYSIGKVLYLSSFEGAPTVVGLNKT